MKVSAREYIGYLMEWIEEQIEDENIFSVSLQLPFPPDFKSIIKQIFRRLFRGI